MSIKGYEERGYPLIGHDYDLVDNQEVTDLIIENEYDVIDSREFTCAEDSQQLSLRSPSRFYTMINTVCYFGSLITKLFSGFRGTTSFLRDSRDVSHRLSSPETLSRLSAEEWSQMVMETYRIAPGKDHSHKVIALDLPLGKFDYYLSLQKAIRSLKLDEQYRPTIDLKLGTHETKKIGILGGVGPDSDAKILKETLKNFSAEELTNVEINILSAPPPRTKWQQLKCGLHYMRNVHRFLNRSHNRVYVASNTAHVNMSTLNKLGRGNIVNLVDHVASRCLTREDNVGIVGTSQAHKKRLYPSYLPRGMECVAPTDRRQDKIQVIIDKQKKGEIRNDDKHRLFRTIKKTFRERNVRQLLLGCTELPKALGKNLIEKLGGKLQCRVIDTEKAFSQKIADDMHCL